MKNYVLLCVFFVSFINASDRLEDLGGGAAASPDANSRGSVSRRKRELIQTPQKALGSREDLGDVTERLQAAGVSLEDSPAKRTALGILNENNDPKLSNDILLGLLKESGGEGNHTRQGINAAILKIIKGDSESSKALYRSALQGIIKSCKEDNKTPVGLETFTGINLDHIANPVSLGNPNRGRFTGGHLIERLEASPLDPVYCLESQNGAERAIGFLTIGKGAMRKTAWQSVDPIGVCDRYQNSMPFAKSPEGSASGGWQLRMVKHTGEVIAVGVEGGDIASRCTSAMVTTIYPFPLISCPAKGQEDSLMTIATRSVKCPGVGMQKVEDLRLTGHQLLDCLALAKTKNNKKYVTLHKEARAVVIEVTKEIAKLLEVTGKKMSPFFMWTNPKYEKQARKKLHVAEPSADEESWQENVVKDFVRNLHGRGSFLGCLSEAEKARISPVRNLFKNDTDSDSE